MRLYISNGSLYILASGIRLHACVSTYSQYFSISCCHLYIRDSEIRSQRDSDIGYFMHDQLQLMKTIIPICSGAYIITILLLVLKFTDRIHMQI